MPTNGILASIMTAKMARWCTIIAAILIIIFSGICLKFYFHEKHIQTTKTMSAQRPTYSINGGINQIGSSNTVNVINDDYVEETSVTYGQLKDFFPFGYAVFYFDHSRRLIHDVYKNDSLEWNLNWDKVDIKPNIALGKVRWIFPFPTAEGADLKIIVNTNWCEIRDFEKGFSQINFPYDVDEPIIFSGVLNDDQSNPVFAIGFRIRTPTIEQDIHKVFGNSFEYIYDGQFPNTGVVYEVKVGPYDGRKIQYQMKP